MILWLAIRIEAIPFPLTLTEHLMEVDKFAEKWETLNAVETTVKNKEDDKKKAEEETMKAEEK